MGFTIVPDGWISKAYKVREINYKGISNVIAKVNAGNYSRKTSIIFSDLVTGWRAYRQKTCVANVNIQIRRNGFSGQEASIGAVSIPLYLAKQVAVLQPGMPPESEAATRFNELTHAIQDGLTRSVGSWRSVADGDCHHTEYLTYKVVGTFSV